MFSYFSRLFGVFLFLVFLLFISLFKYVVFFIVLSMYLLGCIGSFYFLMAYIVQYQFFAHSPCEFENKAHFLFPLYKINNYLKIYYISYVQIFLFTVYSIFTNLEKCTKVLYNNYVSISISSYIQADL